MAKQNDPNRIEKGPDYTRAAMPDFTPSKPGQSPKEVVDLSYSRDQSKKGSVMFGRDSSYSTSSGLINALDLTRGVTNVTSKAIQAQNVMDKNKTVRMQNDLAAAKQDEGWLSMSPDEQFAKTREIQDQYESGWQTAAARNSYLNSRSRLDFEQKKYDLESGLAQLSQDESRMRNEGIGPEESWQHLSKGFEELFAVHGSDEIVRARIQMAQDNTRYRGDAQREQLITNLVNNMQADGSLQKFMINFDPALGYDEFQKQMISHVIKNGGEAAEMALGPGYDPETDTWSGYYADSLKSRLEPMMQQRFNESVKMRVTEDQAQQVLDAQALKTSMSSIGSAHLLSQEGAESGAHMGRMIDQMEGIISLRGSAAVPASKRRAQLRQDFADITKDLIRNSGNPEMLQGKILGNVVEMLDNDEMQNSLFAAMGIDANDTEAQQAAIKEMKDAALSSAKMYADSRVGQRVASRKATSGLTNDVSNSPVTDPERLEKNIKDNWTNQILNNGAFVMPAGPINGDDTAQHASDMVTFSSQMIQGSAYLGMMSPDKAQDIQDRIKAVYDNQATMDDPNWGRDRASEVYTILKAEGLVDTEDSVYTSRVTSEGDMVFQVAPGKANDAIDMKVGVMTSHMAKKEHNGRMVYDLHQGAAGYKKLGQLYAESFASYIDAKPEEQAGRFLKDLTRIRANFDQQGVELYAATILPLVVGPSYNTLEEDTRANLTRGFTQMFDALPDNPDVSQVQSVVDQFTKLKASGGRMVTARYSNTSGTQFKFSQDGGDFDEGLAMALGAATGPEVKETGAADTFEWATFGLFSGGVGGYLPGDNTDYELKGLGLMQDESSRYLITEALQRYVVQNPNQQEILVEGNGNLSLNSEVLDKNNKVAGFFRELFSTNNFELEPKGVDEDGVPVGYRLRKARPAADRAPDGRLQQSSIEQSVSGNFEDSMSRYANDPESGFLSTMVKDLSKGTFGLDGDTDKARKIVDNPMMRRSIVHWGGSARETLTSQAGRENLADRIEASIAVVSNDLAGYETNEDLTEVIAELRSPKGKRSNAALGEYMSRAQEIARAQGFNVKDGDVANFFILAAIAEDVYDVPQWQHGPLSMIPAMDAPNVGDLRNDIGLYNYQFGIKDFYYNGQALQGTMPMPLFAPSKETKQYRPLYPGLFKNDRKKEIGNIYDR